MCVEGKDFVFMLIPSSREEKMQYFCISPKEYWDKNHCMYDRHLSKILKGVLPEGFIEEGEGAFTYKASYSLTTHEYSCTDDNIAEGRQKLLDCGFVEIPYNGFWTV